MTSQHYDIIVFGATGFTGRLITRYLAAHPQFKEGRFTFALGARSQTKLHSLVKDLGLPTEVGSVKVDVTDEEEVMRVVKRAKVIINTVGPYWRWGTPVVKACALNGVHYVDLTGETAWIRDIILKFDFLALKTGAIIVPSCGMDSIPADITTFLSNKTLKAQGDYHVQSSTTGYRFKGGISGGTLSSMMVTLDEIPSKERQESNKDWILSPFKGRLIAPARLVYNLGLPRNKALVGAFFFMQPTNRKLVQRTAGLLEIQAYNAAVAPDTPAHVQEMAKRERYGPSFAYDEFIILPSKLASALFSAVFAIGFYVITLFPIVRWAIKRWGPQSGEGPSEKDMVNGWLHCTNHTVSTSQPPVRVKTKMRGSGDPGYSLTAVFIAESALSLILLPISSKLPPSPSGSLPQGLPMMAYKGGILTPMSAFGNVLVTRLKDTGRVEFDSQICGAGDGISESKKHL